MPKFVLLNGVAKIIGAGLSTTGLADANVGKGIVKRSANVLEKFSYFSTSVTEAGVDIKKGFLFYKFIVKHRKILDYFLLAGFIIFLITCLLNKISIFERLKIYIFSNLIAVSHSFLSTKMKT
jgi:hypothetical protein